MFIWSFDSIVEELFNKEFSFVLEFSISIEQFSDKFSFKGNSTILFGFSLFTFEDNISFEFIDNGRLICDDSTHNLSFSDWSSIISIYKTKD